MGRLEPTKLETLLTEKGLDTEEITYLVSELLEKEALDYVVSMCAADEEYKARALELISK